MPNTSKGSPHIKEIYANCVEERRRRQHLVLRKWDMGKITHRQCIEEIVELEKMIYIGNQLEQLKRKTNG